jgi:hypothetical protein
LARSGTSRALLLGKADLKLKILKLLVRLAYESKAWDEKKYILLEEKLVELGKMLGGWIKATQNPVHDNVGTGSSEPA